MQLMDEIYQKYAQMVYRYLLSKTRSEDLAEELTQEIFYQAIKSIGRYDGSCKISTWLCAIAKNQLHSCPEPYREILYLRIFGGLSFKEIGEIMGKTENWARVSYYRAKEPYAWKMIFENQFSTSRQSVFEERLRVYAYMCLAEIGNLKEVIYEYNLDGETAHL